MPGVSRDHIQRVGGGHGNVGAPLRRGHGHDAEVQVRAVPHDAEDHPVVLDAHGDFAHTEGVEFLRGHVRGNELVVGVTAALVVVGVAVVFIRQWQTRSIQTVDRQLILEEIAALDDAYDAGEIDQADYEQEREALKAELLEIWEEEN